MKLCNLGDNMDGPRGYCAKWNKLEKYKCHMFLLTCEIQKTKQTNKPETNS